jgi:hypothetical protein
MTTNLLAADATLGERTRITAFHPLGGTVPVDVLTARLAGHPAVWIPAPAETAAGGWISRLHAGPVSHLALCLVGAPWNTGSQLWRHVTWQPSDAAGRVRAHDTALPTFRGEIGIVAKPAPTLVLTGVYLPPGGGVGAAADWLVGEHVATATARRWLAEAATRLRGDAAATDQ